jgi:hypothetical protein
MRKETATMEKLCNSPCYNEKNTVTNKRGDETSQGDYSINFRHSRGNLHIFLFGDFSSMCAWELIKIIKGQYSGSGRIFVNTAGLGSVLSDGIDLFKSKMTSKKLPPDWLYFKGEKGFKIAPNGSRVMVRKKSCRRQGPRLEVRSKRPVESLFNKGSFVFK